MARTYAFNESVAARTRAAQAILSTPELLSLYEKIGGLQEDLIQIAESGLEAEAANLGQSLAKGESVGTTAKALLKFETLRKDYVQVMGVVQAVRGDLKRANASEELLATIDQIIKNEAPVRIVTSADEEGGEVKKAKRARSFEAIRAEIQKDAGALLGLGEAQAAFARRKLTPERFKELEREAMRLSGLLGDKTAKKGDAKAATQAEHAAVRAQGEVWGSTYRLLAQLGEADMRVAALLKEAAKTAK